MKKILLIHNKYIFKGGEDTNFEEEIQLLKRKYIVDCLIFENIEKINIFDILSFFTKSNFQSNKILKNKLNEFKPDLVYVHNTWFKANLGIFKILKKHKIKTIIKIHNLRYECSRYWLLKNHLKSKSFCYACSKLSSNKEIFNKYYDESFLKSLILILYSKKFIKLLKNEEFQIFVINNFHKEKLISTGVQKDKISIFYNPLNFESSVFKYNPDSDFIVYAGRITKSKGVEELVALWKKVKLENLKLKIIGDGDQLNYLKSKYEDNDINFLGELDLEDTINLISSSRAVVTCTKMYEGQPRLLSEASICSVPSIYPSFGGMDEFFPDNYDLKFEQFNYKSLESKLYSLQDREYLLKNSNYVNKHLKNILNPESLLCEFKKHIEKI